MTGSVKTFFSGRTLLFLLTIGSSFLVLSILGFMISLSLPLFTENFSQRFMTFTWAPDRQLFGVLGFLCGTLIIVTLSLAAAFLLSLGNAVLIHLLLPPRAAENLYRLVKMMTGIPTVIYGFVGVSLLVPLVREWSASGSGMSILSAALLLALLISPTMILVFVESLAAIPKNQIRAFAALGGNLRQKLLYLYLPGARRGMTAGILLAAGRALGDTMIALMVAGNATAPPESIFDSVRTLTAHIALVMAADFDSLEFRTIFVCGIILYLGTAVLTFAARKYINQKTYKYEPERS